MTSRLSDVPAAVAVALTLPQVLFRATLFRIVSDTQLIHGVLAHETVSVSGKHVDQLHALLLYQLFNLAECSVNNKEDR